MRGSRQSWRPRAREDTKSGGGGNRSSPFQWSDIWNKGPGCVSSFDGDRQTDRGQILPARQINRPRRVGSLQDDSPALAHRKTGTAFMLETSSKRRCRDGAKSARTSEVRLRPALARSCRRYLFSSAAQVMGFLVGLAASLAFPSTPP